MNKIYLSIIAVLTITLLYGWITWPEVTTTTKTEIVEDTTRIDSLQTQVTYWRDIAESEKDTISGVMQTKVAVINTDSTKQHTFVYTDSTLTAEVGLTVEGVIVGDTEFSYLLRRQIVTERTNTNTITRTILERETITKTIVPSGYLSIGVSAYDQPFENIQFMPTVSWTTKNQVRYTAGYNFSTDGLYINVSVPLRFNIPGL